MQLSIFRSLALGLAFLTTSGTLAEGKNNTHIDHIIWASTDRERAVADFAEQTGVTATFGGEHPGLGTANSLASLGDDVYLEIIGPDLPVDQLQGLAKRIAEIGSNQLIGFALYANDLNLVAENAKAAGLTVIGPSNGSRKTPSGELLTWQGMYIAGHDYGSFVPFFIRWEDNIPHPATTSPKGAKLISYKVTHPEAEGLQKIYDAIGFDITVEESETPSMTAQLETPKGLVTLATGDAVNVLGSE